MKKTDTGAYLADQQFQDVMHEIRQCWRMLGMLHLRMQNDIDIGKSSPITIAEIREKIEAVSARLAGLEQTYLTGKNDGAG